MGAALQRDPAHRQIPRRHVHEGGAQGDVGDAQDHGPARPARLVHVRAHPHAALHAEAITIETEKPIDMAKVYSSLNASPGVVVTDDPSSNLYPMPMSASTKYDVGVGRLRKNDVFGENGLDLFVCGDQLLRGAALNAVLIAEKVCD